MPTIDVSDAELSVLLEALDALEYWQLGDELPRHDGMVWIPGDAVGEDRYWARAPSAPESEAINAIQTCRSLARRLLTVA